ncbi:MAG: RluA family pseudouridine synthase [Chthoniobacterales bacterium]
MRELHVAGIRSGWRLDRFLAAEVTELSRSRVQNLIRQGHVLLNGKQPRNRETLRSGDVIVVSVPSIEKLETAPEEIPLHILYEDEDLVVLNKPAGLVVHPGAGHQTHTLVNALLHHCTRLSGIGGKERPGIVHRLDKETSGCLVVAKNDVTHRGLSEQFAARTVEKVYLALVAGVPRKKAGVIDAPIGRHPIHRQRMQVSDSGGRAARTEYRVLRSADRLSLVECTLHSGRTHQIRVHFHHLGHPVLGDKLYAPKNAQRYPRQMLHATKLGFRHPQRGGQMQFEAPLPEDFVDALRLLP